MNRLAQSKDTAESHNRRQIQYFSGRSLPRMSGVSEETPYVARHVQAVVDVGRIRESHRVLDVGCGPGKFTAALHRRGFNVEGMDITPHFVTSLAQLHPEISVHLGDVAHPSTALDGRFDVVTGFFMLHHVRDLESCFRGVSRLLRPGGRVVFCEPNPLFLGYYAQISLTPGMNWRGDGGIVRMRPRSIKRHARNAGFSLCETSRYGLFPPVLANRPRFAAFERTLERIPGWEWSRAFQLFVLEMT